MRLKILQKWLFKKSINAKIDYSELNPFARFFKKNESWILVLQTVLVLITVYFTYFNIKLSISGRRATQQYVELISDQLESLNEQFSSLNEQFFKVEENLRRLPESVAELDSTTKIFGKQMIGLGENMASFKAMLQDINDVTEKQLSLIKETQKKWEEELARKADLKLRVIDVIKDSLNYYKITPEVINIGKKSSKEFTVVIRIDSKFDFNSDGWILYDSLSLIQGWSFHFSRPIGPVIEDTGEAMIKSSKKMPFRIKKPDDYDKNYIILRYIISHEFSQKDSLRIQLP